MRKLFILLLLIVAAEIVYVRYFDGPWPPPWPWATGEALTKKNALAKLSSLIDSHVDSIFAPLDGAMPMASTHDLSKLRAMLADTLATAPDTEKRRYQHAVQLCDTLLTAIQEREQCNLRLASSHTKPFAVGLSQNQLYEEQQKRAFFEGAIALAWAQNSKKYRQQVNRLYQGLRAEERTLASSGGKR